MFVRRRNKSRRSFSAPFLRSISKECSAVAVPTAELADDDIDSGAYSLRLLFPRERAQKAENLLRVPSTASWVGNDARASRWHSLNDLVSSAGRLTCVTGIRLFYAHGSLVVSVYKLVWCPRELIHRSTR